MCTDTLTAQVHLCIILPMTNKRKMTKEQVAARRMRQAADRQAVIATHGLSAWTMPGRTVPSKKREASRRACRGRVSADD
jgi:hypothetical protein